MISSGNKGEWSEIYTILKLLADGKLYAADENLEKIDDVFYPIIKIIREEIRGKEVAKREYILNGNIAIVDSITDKTLVEVPVKDIVKRSISFFDKLKAGKGRSFKMPDQIDFLESLEITSLKAKSTDKSDIKLIVHDFKTGKKPTFGFSVKSLVGKKSTLFNPAPGTNFIYKLSLSEKVDIKEFNTETLLESESSKKKISKIVIRLNRIEDLGGKVEFDSIQSDNLQLNLELIDSSLPEILSYLVYYKYRFGVSKLNELIEMLNEKNPLNYDLSKGHPFYEYKLKNLLSDYALGMTPESVWEGTYDSTGGIIMVKDNGDVLCYHIYNRNEFHNYLLNNTKLEQASTGEDSKRPGNASTAKGAKKYRFGWLYEDDGEVFIKLNLQIRFTN